MAVLTAEEKRIIAQQFVRRQYKELQNVADLDADEILDAIQATEDWIQDNKAAFNTALPNPFKMVADTPQKTLLFCYVAMKQVGLI